MLFLLFNGMKKAKYRFSNKCSIPGLYDEWRFAQEFWLGVEL